MLLRHDEARLHLWWRRRELDGYEPTEKAGVYVLRFLPETKEVVLLKDDEELMRDAVE